MDHKDQPSQNTGGESFPKISPLPSRNEKEKENAALSKLDSNSVQISSTLPKETKAKVPPADIGGKGLQAIEHPEAHESPREELAITPTAAWTPNHEAKPDYSDHPTGKPVCPMPLVKPKEGDKNFDDSLKQGQSETKNPPILACDDTEFRTTGKEKEQKKGSTNGIPIPENLVSTKVNVGTYANSQVPEQPDEEGFHGVATYLPRSTIPKEILAERPSVNSFEGTPLGSLIEQNDKGLPKARRSQSVGQFPNTPNRQKVGQGNSKFCQQADTSRLPLKIWLRRHLKVERRSASWVISFCPKEAKHPLMIWCMQRIGQLMYPWLTLKAS